MMASPLEYGNMFLHPIFTLKADCGDWKAQKVIMKKNYLLAGLLSFGMLLVGCDEQKGSDPSVEPGLKGEMEEITPSKQKARLQDIGLEFVNTINVGTHENLVDVMAYMEEEEFDDLDIDAAYVEKLEALYTETGGDEEYHVEARRINPVEAIQGLMALSLDAAQNGAQLATRADDIYMLTLKAGIKDLYGGFKPNMRDEVWVYDSSINDRLEVQFTDDHNQTWTATLKGSKETTRIHLTAEDIYNYKEVDYDWWYDETYEYESGYHDKYDITIDVPKNITLVVKCNKDKVVDLTVNSNLAFEADVYNDYSSYHNYYEDFNEYESELELTVDYTNLNLDASLNVNGYAENLVTEVSRSGIKASAEVKIDGKSMLKAEAALSADMDALIKQINEANTYSESYKDGEYVYDEEFEFDPTCLKNFSMVLDVMGKAQIYAKCDDGKKLYEAIDLTEEEFDQKYGDYKEEKAFELYVDEINDAYSITIHYDNTSTVQANVELEACIEEYEDYYDEYTEYYIRPVLVFAVDDSRYAFEDYFTESGFSKLIDAVEKLADDFEEMFENAYN